MGIWQILKIKQLFIFSSIWQNKNEKFYIRFQHWHSALQEDLSRLLHWYSKLIVSCEWKAMRGSDMLWKINLQIFHLTKHLNKYISDFKYIWYSSNCLWFQHWYTFMMLHQSYPRVTAVCKICQMYWPIWMPFIQTVQTKFVWKPYRVYWFVWYLEWIGMFSIVLFLTTLYLL